MRALGFACAIALFGCGAANGGGDEFVDDPIVESPADSGAAVVDTGSGGLVASGDTAPSSEVSTSSCTPGATRACGTVTKAVGICKPGSQKCEPSGELGGEWGPCLGEVGPKKEECGNKLDDDCDGMVDEDCSCDLEMKLALSGDCLTVTCPKEAPYPIGCDVKFTGGDDRGCVAYKPGASTVFFKEGNICSAGYLEGTMKCSCKPGTGLNATNCPINKPTKIYVTSSSACPT